MSKSVIWYPHSLAWLNTFLASRIVALKASGSSHSLPTWKLKGKCNWQHTSYIAYHDTTSFKPFPLRFSETDLSTFKYLRFGATLLVYLTPITSRSMSLANCKSSKDLDEWQPNLIPVLYFDLKFLGGRIRRTSLQKYDIIQTTRISKQTLKAGMLVWSLKFFCTCIDTIVRLFF